MVHILHALADPQLIPRCHVLLCPAPPSSRPAVLHLVSPNCPSSRPPYPAKARYITLPRPFLLPCPAPPPSSSPALSSLAFLCPDSVPLSVLPHPALLLCSAAFSGLESSKFALKETLSNQMGLFLQKTNIIRDYLVSEEATTGSLPVPLTSL